MSEYNLGGIPDDDEFDRKSAGQYDLTGIPDDNDSDDVAASLQQKYNSANQNPDQIATAKRHAEKAGIPMLVAQNQPDKAAKLANAPDWTRLTKDAPVTARTLANDGTLFQVAHDDHDSLSGIEQGLVTLGKALPVVGQVVQSADTARGLIDGLTGSSIMGNKNDVGTVLKKYQENWMPQARKTALGLFLAGDSALANLTAANKGGGTAGWYYRQNKDTIDAEADRIVRLADSHDPIEQNRALQIAQEYGFDSVPRYMNGDKSANKAALIDAISNSEAQRNFENRDDQQDRLNRQGALVDMIHGYDQQLQDNAVEVDPYTVPWLISNSMQFVDQMARGMALGTVAGPFGAAIGFGAPVAGQSFATDKAAGKTDSEAASNAIASTLIEATTEMVGAKSIENAAKGLMPILQGVGRAAGVNFSQEQAAEIAGQVYNGFANQDFVDQPDYIKELDAPDNVKQFLALLDNQLQAGVIGAVGGGGMAAVGAAGTTAAEKYGERKQAKLDERAKQIADAIDTANGRAAQIQDTIEKVRASKLRARDTSSLRSLIQSVGDAETNEAPAALLLSADAFKQGGIDPDVFKRAVPSAADQVDRAIELGGTISIDIGELANITDSEVEQGLIPHLKVSEDEWTQYETESAEQYADEGLAEMQAAAEQAAKDMEQQDEWDKQRQEIQTAYEDQLNKVGQYDKAANKKMATLVSSFYTVAASKLAKERPDITPVKLMNESMMRVSGGMGNGQGFNHDGAGKTNSIDKQARIEKRDTDYMAAVERGDMNVAQKLVNEAAAEAGYKIIAEKADAAHLYFNGDSIAELGFDNGKGYAYKNTKNNRKLLDTVTRDDNGNIIPLSKRFNSRKSEEFYHGETTPRGFFNPNTLNINLLEKADLSTFLHETGHFFLEMYSRYADQSAEIGKDMDAVLRQFGIEGDDPASRLAKWRSMPVNEQRQFHEQFAESFEQYLFTGKAPSVELQPIFHTFRSWLKSVYQSLARFVATHSGAKLNPELSGVFDRMLATDKQIEAAQQAREARSLFASAEQAGMTQAQWDSYLRDQARSIEEATDALVARSLRDMKWLTNAKGKQLRKLQREAQSIRARVQMEARRAILSRPEYRAWLALKRPVEKLEKPKRKNSKELDASVDNLLAAIAKLGGLDMEEVVSSWGVDPADFAKKSGVFGKPVLRKTGGQSIETMAERLMEEGYLTPDEHGKYDIAEFEEKLDRAARGDMIYSMFADYDLLLHGERQQMNVDRNNLDYIGVRLNRQDVAEMLEGMAATADSGNVSNGFFQDDDEGDSAPKQRSIERMLSDDGLHPGTVAELFGLSSGDELVRKLLEMDDPFTAIDKLTDKIMLERHSEFTDTKAMERMAEAAIHNEARVRFVATELAMLNKAQGGQKDLKRIIDAARLYAQDLLAGQRIQDIRPSKHAADAARAGKAAERAFAKGNIAETIMAKRNQVLHTELVRQANAAKDTVESGLKYFARIEKAVNNGVLDADYAQQIVGLLQAHDLRKSTSLLDLERRESLMAWVKSQQDAGLEPMIPEHLLLEAQKTHYKRMTLDEFNALVDAIKNIEHLGRLKYKLVQNARKRELAAAAAEIGETIADNATGEVPARLEKNSVKDRVFDLVNGFLYMHRKFASLIRQIDGWKDGGVLWDYFGRTMNDAGDREAVMREQATMAMADLMKPLHASGGFGMMPKKLFITQIGTSLTREGRLMVALNCGNEGNRQRLMDGEGWDANQVNAVLATLNAEDWKFVQGVWDHLETYRPLVGEQQKRLSGVEPKWIEASPFIVTGRDGQVYELRGGYLPVKYDADRSTKSLTQDALSTIMDQHKAVRAKTRDSFTKGRAAKVMNRPLRKDFGVIFQHLTEVTHRLAWQDWLIDSKRLLAQPATDEAIRKHYGPKMVEELQKTLDDIATGEVGPANEFEAAINHLRTGATVAGLGLNVMTSLLQPLGLTQSMVRIGPIWVMKGLARWGRMDDALPWIYERSDFMRLRGKTFQREINEELNKIRSPKRAAFNELMFVLIQKGQIIADVPTWLGAYEKAIAEQGANIDEALAAKLADQAVLDAQSGGMQKDLARIQRGGSLQRLFTMFYSYFSSTYNLSVESARKIDAKNPATILSAGIDFLLLYSLPAAISTAMSSALTGDDDDNEFWDKMARGQASYFLSVMVGLREFGSVVNGFSGYAGPAGTRFFNEAAKLATQVGQGDIDAAMLKALNNAGGILFHYPAGQINKTVQGASALLDDETDNPAALLFGHQK